MQTFKIPFQEIGSIPQLIKDFLYEEIPQFAKYKYSVENIEEVATEKGAQFTQSQREILVQVLEQQLKELTLSAKQTENLQKLLQPNTFTVTTGHQLNLFSGPAFFVYKILQTIKTADVLEKKSSNQYVPIFWMATEDHDFEEINHFKTARNFYQIKGNSGGAVGRIVIEDTQFIKDFEKEFRDDVFGTQLILLIKKAYQPGRTLTDATRILVQELFSEFGLLMIDGDDVLLKNQMKEVFSAELKEEITYQFSQKNIVFLTERYGKVQVNPREINLFYLSDTRNRIVRQGDKFQILDQDKTFTLEEFLQDLSKISPNALLRPVFQEKVLPNVAYVGGNAEIMYWLEMPEVFKRFQVVFPVLIPRNSMLFLTRKTYQKIEKSELDILDFFGNFQARLNQKILQESSLTPLLQQNEKKLKEHFTILKTKASLTDVTFKNLVEAEETRQMKSFARMQKRLLRAEKIKNADRLDFLQRLFFEVHPNGNWQERQLNFSVFFSENGSTWLAKCYEQMEVDKSLLILMEY